MFKKHLVVILSEKDFIEDKTNKTRLFNKNDVYFYAGYNNLNEIFYLVENKKYLVEHLNKNPPLFCEVDLLSVVLPLQKIKLKLDNKIMWACYFKNKFILVPSEHLHKINNKYNYINTTVGKS
jgi:hypothetical protein